jgi:integrase
MAYIIERHSRFYVVDYDGVDPHTNKERRRWHPAGRSRADAEAIAARLTAARNGVRERSTSALTVGEYLVEQWMPRRYRELRPSTAKRYEWIVQHYLVPAIGLLRLTALHAEHLNRLYTELLDRGSTTGGPLSAKTVYDAHVVISSALKSAVERHLVDHNASPPRNTKRSRPAPEVWTAGQLAEFLAHTAHLRLYPALHLTALTGMRRGEVVGLRWSDWNQHTHQLSIARIRQAIPGGTIEVPTKTAASRRSIRHDERSEQILSRWRRHQISDGHPSGHNDPIFTNPDGKPLNPESLTQLFDRKVRSSGLPRIRFHDLRHTHASLLSATGTSIRVVTERLGHAHPAFTIDIYQHVMPGMGADAARAFAALIGGGLGDNLLDVRAPAVEQLALVVVETSQAAGEVDDRHGPLAAVAVEVERQLPSPHSPSNRRATQPMNASSLIVAAATWTIVSTVSSSSRSRQRHPLRSANSIIASSAVRLLPSGRAWLRASR